MGAMRIPRRPALALMAAALAACGKEASPAPAAKAPATARKPRDDQEERRQRLLRRLDAQRLFNIDWPAGSMNAAEAVVSLREATGLNLVLTPEARERAAAMKLPSALAVHDETTRSVLDRFLPTVQLKWEVRSGVILLRLDAEHLPVHAPPQEPAAPETPEVLRMRELIGLRRLDISLDDASVAEALDYLAWQTGLRFERDESLADGAKGARVSLHATDVTVADALDLLLLEAYPDDSATYDVTPDGVKLTRRP